MNKVATYYRGTVKGWVMMFPISPVGPGNCWHQRERLEVEMEIGC